MVRVGCLAVGEGCGHARTRAWVLWSRARGRNDQDIHRILSQVPSEGALGNLGDGKYIIATLRRQLIRLCVPSRIGQNRNTTCLQPPWHFGDHSTLNSQTTYLHRSPKNKRECTSPSSSFKNHSSMNAGQQVQRLHVARKFPLRPLSVIIAIHEYIGRLQQHSQSICSESFHPVNAPNPHRPHRLPTLIRNIAVSRRLKELHGLP